MFYSFSVQFYHKKKLQLQKVYGRSGIFLSSGPFTFDRPSQCLKITSKWGKNQLFIQKLSRFWCLKNMNFVKNETLEMWILWKMRFWYCEFCEKKTFKMWILSKMRFSNHEFLDKLRIFAQCVNVLQCFVVTWPLLIYKPQIESW